MTPEEIHRLIVEAAEGLRELSADELNQILEHVAEAGFDPSATERVRGRLASVMWAGRVLRGRDVLPPAELKYLWHVVVREEWPRGTGLTEYLDSIRQVIRDPSSGVFTSRFGGAWQLGIVRESGDLRGPEGRSWLLVEYRLATGRWVTAFQPENGLDELTRPARSDLRWQRRPKSRSEQL